MTRLFHIHFYLKQLLIINLSILITITSFGQITEADVNTLLNDTNIRTGHIGISIYDANTNQYLYNYNAEKYFIPASNTKLFTLYAGMKYLGDSLIGLRYNENDSTDNSVNIYPTGDPTFLHPDFKKQPVVDFLNNYSTITFNSNGYNAFLGKGWAWDDYLEDYMVPRSEFPMYGNSIQAKWIKNDSVQLLPKYFSTKSKKSDVLKKGFEIVKSFDDNNIYFFSGSKKQQTIPFRSDMFTIIHLLNDTLKNKDFLSTYQDGRQAYNRIVYSQPTDALFKPMMYNSDNFFAEQTLLMVSNERIGSMNDKAIIDTLLNNDLKDIPQKPQWVDGSGLSRYNLFTPQSFIYILNKMKNEFGINRLKKILPAGNTGTLKGYYQKDSAFIFAKTGSLSNNTALSGFVITKKNKLLIFSIVVNNSQGPSTPVKRKIETFLINIRENN